MEQTGLGLAESRLGVATGKLLTRRQQIRFDDQLHIAGP